MTARDLVTEAMSLPIAERVALAQALWADIDENLHDSAEEEALDEAIRRNAEMSSGKVIPISHADAMKAARRAVGCE